MPGYSMELYDIGNGNGETTSSNATLTKGGNLKKPGCYVSSVMGFVLVFLALVVVVGVALIVFFAQNSNDVTCRFEGSGFPEGEAQAIQSCKEWIGKGESAAAEICTACPVSPTAPTTTTTATTTGTTPPSTTSSPSYPRERYRLPGTVKPYHYKLRLQPNIYGTDPSTFNFEGSVTIYVRCTEPTDIITLHVDRLNIQPADVSVRTQSAHPVAIRNITYERDPHFYHIHLGATLTRDAIYTIEFRRFTGNLSTDGQGLYLSSYRDGNRTVYLATTQFEAPYARKAFPCFDEPAMKATFSTTLVRKTQNTERNYITLSNMDIVNTVSSGEWTEDVYRETMVMSTYLLAFIVCDYSNLTDHLHDIAYSTWARPNGIQYAEKAQAHGLTQFEYFETNFDPKYSTIINKLDNIAIPDFNSGAMENWGLITYRETLLYKPGVTSASDEEWIAEVISHEIAHMWFGNVVSPKWWTWLWLNEAFASFWDVYSVEKTNPTWRMLDIDIVVGLHSIMTSDALASSHPMSADVETRAEVSSIFDGVTYTKGAYIVRMMMFIMGEEKFIEGLNIYLETHKFSVAEHMDLWRALNNVTTQNMTLRMDPWVTQMGYPVVKVSRQGQQLTLRQERFLLGSEENTDDRYKDPPYDYQWEIPVTYTTSEERDFSKNHTHISWLEKNGQLSLTLLPGVDWYILNIQQWGYFRVNYDSQNWDALIRQLKADHKVIHPVNRAQIINDAWNLVKDEQLPMTTALRVLEYLPNEVDYVPWRAFAREMDYVELMLDRSELYEHLEVFMRKAVSASLDQLGLDIEEDWPIYEIYARQQVAQYACSYGHPTCVNTAKQQFENWRATGANGINANLRSQFYCTAVEYGGQTEWKFAYQMYKAEDDASENARLRAALACTKEPSLLQRLLSMSMDTKEIRTQDIRATIESVAYNRWGRDIAFNFLVENFNTLVNMMSASNMNRLIATTTSHFNTKYHLVLLNMLETSTDTSSFTPAITQARAQTETNMQWLEKYVKDLQDWLKPVEIPSVRLNYRLPDHFQPLHYTVRLQPHFYGNDSSQFYFQGSCIIEAKCKNATNVITLHMDRLNISMERVTITAEGSGDNLFTGKWDYEKERHFLMLQLSTTLTVGQVYVLNFSHFTGPLTTDGNGFYYSYYRDGEETVYLATTQMEPPYARKTFPCFDEPSLKAKFDITLVRRNDTSRHYNSLANTDLISSEPVIPSPDGNAWVEDRFNTTPIMPTYLLAFIVSDYVYLENMTTSGGKVIPYRTYSRPNAIQWAGRAQEVGLKMFEWLERHFEPPYSDYLDKMDNVAVPDFNFGAMENWGLMIYREAILYQPGVTSASYEYWATTVLAHEIAHMWFGDVVSPKWWNYLWLNEAFASWWDVYCTQQVFPHWAVLEEFISSSEYSTMDSDALATSHPMTSDVQSPAEVNAVFSGVTYNKGAAIIRMMQFIMGFDNFVAALNTYLRINQQSNADTQSLWAALDARMLPVILQENYVTGKMDPWVTQMGYPVVMVNRTATGYRLTQKRFLIGSEDGTDERYKNPKYNYQWEIPIVYATKGDTNMNKSHHDIKWLHKNQDLFIAEPSANDSSAWILLNIDHVGYFRVLYDDATWQALIDQLNSDPTVFTAINRGHFINDAWNLVKAGLLNMSVALQTLDFLQSETSLGPWQAFGREIGYVEKMLERTDLYPDFTEFMKETVSGPLTSLTLVIPDNMVPTSVFVRTEIAKHACKHGLVGCVNEARRLFKQWRDTGKNTINPNLRRQFYCTAVAEGAAEDWEFVLQKFKVVDDTTESLNLRNALACSKELNLIRRLLNMVINENEIRTQDVRSTLQLIASNPVARDIAFLFFVDNFNAIKPRLEPLHLGYALLDVTSHFNTESNLQQLQQFSSMTGVNIIQSAIDQAIATTRTNMAWLSNNLNPIRDWLHARKNPVTPAPKNYRLPTNLVPYHYNVRLKPYIYGTDAKQFYFEGSVKIFFTCKNETRDIVLHQDRLTINRTGISVTQVDDPGTTLAWDHITEDNGEEQFHFYKVHMRDPLVPGKNYSIDFPYFRGDMRDGGEGLYLSSYKDGTRTVYVATTQMEATYARQVFPCFDEPGLKATFNTTLVRKMDTGRDYITLSNMALQSSNLEHGDGNFTEDHFETSMIMSTYLLAFIVCDYKNLTDVAADGTLTSTYARPNRIDEAKIAQKDGLDLLNWYNEKFEPNYRTYNSKVDHIAIQNFNAGAMENWGLITYRETMLYNAMSTASTRSWIATVFSHELAHMWFGNKVSPRWWDWLWLNEAFASYWETYAVEELKPTWKSNSEVDMTSGVFNSMQVDGYTTSHPLSNPVGSPSEIDAQFSTITYTKGGGIIGMMHMIMGEDFIPALNLYLTKNQLGNAEHSTLFDALDEYLLKHRTCPVSLNMTDIMLPWVTQMNHPVVNVQNNNGTLTLTQERFLYNKDSVTPDDVGQFGYKYEVPIDYTTNVEKNFSKSCVTIQFLHKDEPLNMSIGTVDWYVLNLRHRGFYRVNYDEANWNALIAQLNSDHTAIHEVNRAAIIDDAFNLAQAGMLDLRIALRTLDYMRKETFYGPWRVFARETDYMERMIERTELFAPFQRFMQDTVDEPLTTLGYDLPADNDPPYRVFKMSWIISDACHYDHKGCVNKATSMVGDWKMNLPNKINVNIRARFYCTAVREGGHDVWEFIYQKYQDEADSTERSRLRGALGCSKDPTILMTFLDMCLYDPEVPVSETYNCIDAVANNRYGRDVALNFVLEHFPQLKSSVSAGTLRNIISVVTQHFHNNYHLSQLQFLADTYDTSTVTAMIRTVKERTLTNMKWMETNYNIVKDWLDSKSSSGGSTVPINYRLPTSVVPYHYDLHLQPNIYTNNTNDFSFNGTVKIWVTIKEPTNNISLHAFRPIDIESIRTSTQILSSDTGSDTGLVQAVTYDEPRQVVNILAKEELKPNDTYIVYMSFNAPRMLNDGVGLYYSSYKDGNQTVYLATTKFEAPYARRAFPCFDEPAMKATFDVTLYRLDTYEGRSYNSKSNNELKSTRPESNGWVADSFETTLKSPTYLMAFIVSDFKCLENNSTTTNIVTYRTCARPNAFQHGQMAQDYGLKEFKYLEDHFEPIYNMTKLDNMAIPDFLSGAMENWGLITYRESLLYEEGVTTASTKGWIAEVVAHELAHMWFGNIVSPKWWNWLWLNEAFASFWDFHIVEDATIEPLWRMTEQFIVQSMHSVMATDSLRSSHPLTASVESPSQIQSIFDSITYSKGAAIVRMMHFIMGEDEFIEGLNIYLDNRQYDVAEHKDLWDALDQSSMINNLDLNMTDLMDPWVTQMNYPVVKVTWTQSGQVTLTQERYLSTEGGGTDDGMYGYKWDIPITWATSENPTTNPTKTDIVWFHKNMTSYQLDSPNIPDPSNANNWILLNIQQYGYYRVLYEESTWNALINQLNRDHTVFHPINRAQIINDAWTLAKSGHLNMSIALRTLDFLRNDDDYVPWRAMSSELGYINRMLSRTVIYGDFQDYMVTLVNSTFFKLGMENSASDTPIQIFQRERIVSYACEYGIAECRENASQLFSDWTRGEANLSSIDVNLRSVILCNGIRGGTKKEWEFALTEFIATEQATIRSALSCTTQPWLLQRMMEMTLDNTVFRSQDTRSIIEAVAANPVGRDLAWSFFKQNYNQLTTKMTPGNFGSMVVAITQHFNTQTQLDEVRQYMSDNDISNAATAFRNVIEQTTLNILWLKNYYNVYKEFLSSSV